jgi:hypothetical protein
MSAPTSRSALRAEVLTRTGWKGTIMGIEQISPEGTDALAHVCKRSIFHLLPERW